MGVQVPPAELFVTCPWPIGLGPSLPNSIGGFDSRRALLIGDRLTVGRLPLKQLVRVQVLLPELITMIGEPFTGLWDLESEHSHSGAVAAGSDAWL